MATEIKIHRGNQIGGCITEIWTEKARILIDFGEELPGSKSPERFDLDWGASTGKRKEKPAVSAVFFTHYHGDHSVRRNNCGQQHSGDRRAPLLAPQ